MIHPSITQLIRRKGNLGIIVRLLALLLLTTLSLPTYGADLFGNEESIPGELPIGEQKEIYDQFFGTFDKNATNSTKKLKLAIQLKANCENEKYAPMRRYMIMRIQDLTNDSKKYHGYALQVYAFIELNKHRDPDHTLNRKLIDLLSKQLGKAPKDEQEAIIQEIANLCNQNAGFSLKEKNYDLACEDYKTLASYLAKTKDKEGALLAKRMISHIKRYLKDQKKALALKEKADADDTDSKSHAAVGRFYLSESDWATAHPYLIKGQETILAEIAAMASLEKPDINQQGQCAVAIGKALMDKNNKKDIPLRRAILALGLSIKSVLENHQEALSPALKIKYSLVSEEWNAEFEKLGPNPLKGFEVSSAGSSIDEARLVRMGWVPIFDHESTSMINPAKYDKNSLDVSIKNGVLILDKRGESGCNAEYWGEITKYKSFKIRFKYSSEDMYGWITFGTGAWNDALARICIRQEQAGLSSTYNAEYGRQVVLNNEWNDLTITINGKELKASLNGEAYEKAMPFPHDQIKNLSIALGGIRSPMKLHIQSVLGLPK